MKTLHASLLLALSLPVFAQKPGESVTPEALGKAEWVQGTAPAEWEPGKLYVIECWATWCGPCIAAIPHVDELYDKYQEKGLRVIGMNVWEDGKDKVETFVKKKGDGMSYPVAYVGKGGAFEESWLKSAEVTGIPHAFVVKDGKVLFSTHPMQLKEDVVEDLLAGGEKEAAAIAKIAEARKASEKMSGIMMAFRKASAENDVAGMGKAIDDLKAADPEARYIPMLELELIVAKKNWSAAEERLASAKETESHPMVVFTLAQKITREKDTAGAPAAFLKTLAGEVESILAKGKPSPMYCDLARLQWAAGEKEAAKTSADKVLEWANTDEAKKAGRVITPFTKFAEAVKGGEMPTQDAMNEWAKEARAAATEKEG